MVIDHRWLRKDIPLDEIARRAPKSADSSVRRFALDPPQDPFARPHIVTPDPGPERSPGASSSSTSITGPTTPRPPST